MRRRAVEVEISDHAVLRWLERAQGLDVRALKAMLAGKVLNAAELQAVAVCLDGVRFLLRERERLPGGGVASSSVVSSPRSGPGQPLGAPARVVVPTVLKIDQRRGDGVSHEGRGSNE